jgi:hypothetical protein
MANKILLKQDTEMNTGYQGRGIPTQVKIFPKGTEVIYNKQITKAGIYHTVHLIDKNGTRWEASKKTEVK